MRTEQPGRRFPGAKFSPLVDRPEGDKAFLTVQMRREEGRESRNFPMKPASRRTDVVDRDVLFQGKDGGNP